MIQIELFGKLIPWKAPLRNGNHYYSPVYKEKEQVRWQIRAQFRDRPIEGAVSVDFNFFFRIPKSASRIKRLQMLNGVIVPVVTPDATNLQKFYEDCLKEIVIMDDKQVSDVSSRRRYSEKEGVMIRVMTFQEKYGNSSIILK